MSLVNSTIDEYVLASFALPGSTSSNSSSTSSNFRPSSLSPPPATSVQYPNIPKQDGRLVVATPGVGVSIYDLADQTPLSSITVGPSFAPTTSAVARSVPLTSSESIRVKSTRQTWVGVRTEEGKGEIWCWQEEERKDGSSESEAGKAVWPISEPLAALAVPKTLPSHLVFLSSSGSFALAPANDLTSLVSLPYQSSESSTSSGPAPSAPTLRLIPVSSTSALSFLPTSLTALLPAASSSLKAHIAIIVRSFGSSTSNTAESASLTEIGKKKFKKTPRPSASAVTEAAEALNESSSMKNEIEVVLLDPEVQVEGEAEPRSGVVSLGRVTVEADKVVVSDDGFVTSLTADGTLSSSRLSVPSPTAESYSDVFFSTGNTPSPPTLALTPVKSLTLSSSTLIPAQATLLALRSSFVLLAAPRASADGTTPVVSLTYWDTRFGAVIASSNLSVPSAVATSPSSLSLSACLPTRNTAILTLAPSASTSSSSRIALFCLPLSPPLPSASVLAAIVGRQRLTAQYLAHSESTDSILAKAKRAEPILSSSETFSSQEREAALAGRQSRELLLESLDKVLAPLKQQGNIKESEKAVITAETEWSSFLEKERKRSWDVERPKLAKRRKEVAEARVKELKTNWSEGVGRDGRWKRVKRVVERAIVEAGASIELDSDAATGKSAWQSVMKEEIEGVDAADRQRYAAERSQVEADIQRLRKEADGSLDETVHPEPTLPSSFVTAVLRLCFPVPLDAPSTEISAPGSTSNSSASTWRHPTAIVSYLLKREIVGENQLEGGLTRYLARAGDWSNVVLALEHVTDIPETTAVSLLLTVIRSPATVSENSMDVDSSSSLPSSVPSLRSFLAAFLRQSYTPSTLRQALQKQVTATEALPILELCDEWLGWWLKNGGSIEQSIKSTPTEFTEDKTQMVLVDPFKSRSGDDLPPSADEIVPLVQSLLDAHFVTLLLQRQSHKLLRRLTSRVSSHTAQLDDLSTLLGALSVFSRKNAELAEAEQLAKRKANAKRNGVQEVKKFGESMGKRSKAHEKHQEVGAYQVEEFYL
ncbi:uncharacterized protein JCM6883_005156 [Sporobolomyces salmoneus]|uniref:uncharacterized protein n=1 Tax=Sporobolomyces salmoneus TaxID=183962 RepID=UPI0031700904